VPWWHLLSVSGAIAVLNGFTVECSIQKNGINDNANNRQGQIAEEDTEPQGQDCYGYGKRPDYQEATDEQNDARHGLSCYQPTNSVEAKERA